MAAALWQECARQQRVAVARDLRAAALWEEWARHHRARLVAHPNHRSVAR
jgi:hypothetical protein